MKTQIRHSPHFAIARCVLGPQETINVESGAMVAHSEGMTLTSKMKGGLGKALGRKMLGGESFFISTFAAPPSGGWVDVAHHLPGDILRLNLNSDHAWFVERGGWLASEPTVTLETKWQGGKSLFGGEGGFMARVSGAGKVLVSTYGAVDGLDLAAGETVVVDTSHMLAFSDTISYELKRAVQGRTFQSMKSGEGFVFHVNGPGKVFIQTRNRKDLLGWITQHIPKR